MSLLNVVLVDDEVFTRKGIIKLIDWKACGFRVAGEADNGEDALELIGELRPDLIITDIRMPVLDGLELIRRVVSEAGASGSPAFLIISGYDDFKYAQQAVRYGVHDFLLKPVDEEEISDTLRRLSAKLQHDRAVKEQREQFLSSSIIESVIMGNAEEGQITKWEEQLGLKTCERLYYAFVELNDLHPWSSSSNIIPLSRFKDRVQEALYQLVGEGEPLYLHEHRNRIGMILPEKMLKSYNGQIRRFAADLIHELESDQEGRIFVYVGKHAPSLHDIRHSFESAKEALQYKFVYDESGIVLMTHDASEAPPPLRYLGIDQGLFRQFLEQIEELNSDSLELTIRQLFEHIRQDRIAPEAVKASIHQCVLGVVNVLRQMGGDMAKIAALEPLLGWHDLNLSLRELRRLFRDFAIASAGYISELRSKQHSGGIQDIRTYIEQHYNQNINLKSIAAKFFMNPVYLGQLFKKTYGMYFNDYLLQLRISEARRLLRQSDLRVYEVAERVGFSNADYFVTQFEKMEKVTPTEYRNRLKRAGSERG